MAYNNGFPATYQPIYYQPQYQPMSPTIPQQPTQPAQPTQSSGLIWVQGEAGAKSYLVAPNTTVQLWDSERQTIYLKSADASGMPSMRILDYAIRGNTAQTVQIAQPMTDQTQAYATHAEIEALEAQIKALQMQINTDSGAAKHGKKEGEVNA